MKRFVEGEYRQQGVLLPEFLDDYVSEENPGPRDRRVRRGAGTWGCLGSRGGCRGDRAAGLSSGPAAQDLCLQPHQPVASSRRLEREAERNVELM
jgi:hypothetical protein